jgi:hypothetical protein
LTSQKWPRGAHVAKILVTDDASKNTEPPPPSTKGGTIFEQQDGAPKREHTGSKRRIEKLVHTAVKKCIVSSMSEEMHRQQYE